MDCKLFVVNLDIDLTQEMESQLQTGFIKVQVMAYVLLQWFRVTWLHSLSTQGSSKIGIKKTCFVIACSCQRGEKFGYIHVLLDDLWKCSWYYIGIHTLLEL